MVRSIDYFCYNLFWFCFQTRGRLQIPMTCFVDPSANARADHDPRRLVNVGTHTKNDQNPYHSGRRHDNQHLHILACFTVVYGACRI